MKPYILHEGRDGAQESLVAPHLTKPGLRFTLPAGEHTLDALVQEGIVTQEQIRDYGFLVLDGIGNHTFPDEGVLSDDTKIQFIHRDYPHDSHNAEDGYYLVALRYPQQPNPRRAFTILGESGAVLRGMAEFLARETSPLPPAMEQVRREMLAVGIDVLHPSLVRPDGHTWNDQVFLSLATRVRGSGYERLPALYEALRPVLYFHAWEPGQLLLLDDTAMVHARLPFPDTPANTQGGYMFRRKLAWSAGTRRLEPLE